MPRLRGTDCAGTLLLPQTVLDLFAHSHKPLLRTSPHVRHVVAAESGDRHDLRVPRTRGKVRVCNAGAVPARVFLGAVVLAFSWWVTSLRPFTTGTTVAVLGAGLAAVAVGLISGPGARRRRERAPGLWGWAVLATGLVVWELMAWSQHPRANHPTLSSMTNDLLDPDVVRAFAFAAWLVAGAAIARR
jgi:hypothetical protein